MIYSLTINNLHIEDSYKVHKWEMPIILEHIKMSDETPTKVWNRSMFSLRMEWVCHNFLYRLRLWKSRTKDVDLNYPNKWGWLYNILGCLVYVFIK